MQLVFSSSNDPAYNLATEEYLFSKGEDEYAFFYCNNPCVVIGCNQVWRNEVNAFFCEENQIPVLRRLSGGGAVYHDRGNLNYSFITNKTPQNPGTTPDFLHPVVVALARLGIMSIVGPRKDLWLPGGYKISGTASHVTMNRVLQHGTLLYDTNLEMLQGALNLSRQQPAPSGSSGAIVFPGQSAGNAVTSSLPGQTTGSSSTSSLSGQSAGNAATSSAPARGIPSVPSPVKNIVHYLIDKAGSSYTSFLGASVFYKELVRELGTIMCLSEDFELTLEDHSKIVAIKNSRYDREEWNRRK